MGSDADGPSFARLAQAMAATPVFERVPRASLRTLIGSGSTRRFRRGSYLFHQGDEAGEIFFIHEGRVELTSLSPTGSRGLHTAVEPPQLIGELGVLGESVRSTSAIALEDVVAWTCPGSAFVSFLGRHADASLSLLRAFARQIDAHSSLVDDLLFLDLKGRVAKRLIGLVSPNFNDVPRDGAVVPSIVTHADLASLAGGSRENVTRILSELQRRGIVQRSGRRYVLKNIAALRKLAGMA